MYHDLMTFNVHDNDILLSRVFIQVSLENYVSQIVVTNYYISYKGNGFDFDLLVINTVKHLNI